MAQEEERVIQVDYKKLAMHPAAIRQKRELDERLDDIRRRNQQDVHDLLHGIEVPPVPPEELDKVMDALSRFVETTNEGARNE